MTTSKYIRLSVRNSASAFLAAIAFMLFGGNCLRAETRPNVIPVMTDDQGYQLPERRNDGIKVADLSALECDQESIVDIVERIENKNLGTIHSRNTNWSSCSLQTRCMSTQSCDPFCRRKSSRHFGPKQASNTETTQ